VTEQPSSNNVLVRVWLPDRPGALGLVAARIGSVGGDIVGVDVLERSEGVVVDEFAVALPSLDVLELLAREIEQVDGASVEEIRVVGAFPDPRLDALESAATLCEATSPDALRTVLVAHLHREFLADWAALLVRGEVAARAGDTIPSTEFLAAVAAGTAVSPKVADGTTGPDDLLVAALAAHDATVMVGRDGHPFRRRERAQLRALARIADRAWALLT
jgi:predicted nucleic acid-binding protein